MANIIENKKTWRIQHRFDTQENWNMSQVLLKAGELAFDEFGNFKVGRTKTGEVWNSLPYSGTSKIVSGNETPSISTNKGLVPGDIFKNEQDGIWYILTGFDSISGEYIWEVPKFSSDNIDEIISGLESQLSLKADKSEVDSIKGSLDSFASKESVQELEAKMQETSDRLSDSLSDISSQIDNISSNQGLYATKEELQSNVESISSQLDTANSSISALQSEKADKGEIELVKSEISGINSEIESIDDRKADKTDVELILDDILNLSSSITSIKDTKADKEETLLIKQDIQGLSDSVDVVKQDIQELNSSVNTIKQEKVDSSSTFDESGKIRSSLLPGYVDDVIEGVLTSDGEFITSDKEAEVGISGKLYIDINTGKTYRWSGTRYVDISGSDVVLGTTEGTAYEGSSGLKLEENVSKLSTTIDETENKVKNLQKNVYSISQKITTLEANDESQDNRLSETEKTVIEHIKSISSLDTETKNQARRIGILEEKVDNILKVDTPDGELTLGSLAFKSTVTNDDIESVSFSKITQDEDDEIEFYCGTASE